MYSKETPNLKLPQWQPLDHPDFLTDFNESFKKIDKLGQVIPDNEKQQEQIDNLTKQIVDLTEVIKELEDNIDDMSDIEVILQMKEDIDKLKAEVAALTEKNATQDTSIGEITAHLTIIDSDISTIKQRLDDYKATIDSNTTAIGQNSQSITELENSLATLQTTVTNILTRLSAVEQLANQNQNNISEINTTMASLQNSVSGAVSAAEQAGQDATSAVNMANLAHSDAENAVSTANAAKATADEMDARITAAQGTADSAVNMATEASDAVKALKTIDKINNGWLAAAGANFKIYNADGTEREGEYGTYFPISINGFLNNSGTIGAFILHLYETPNQQIGPGDWYEIAYRDNANFSNYILYPTNLVFGSDASKWRISIASRDDVPVLQIKNVSISGSPASVPTSANAGAIYTTGIMSVDTIQGQMYSLFSKEAEHDNV